MARKKEKSVLSFAGDDDDLDGGGDGEEPALVVKKMKNPTADTDFLPDREKSRVQEARRLTRPRRRRRRHPAGGGPGLRARRRTVERRGGEETRARVAKRRDDSRPDVPIERFRRPL